ncbi:MAG: SBBP repeat-containing protein [Ignavibacteriae bacterium]|nr:SBBP repeat-containing protein [Ignavibacteria bacterium]MBI3364323.1 SBBP repeat-containing protein [Ignavibacteriota bacterium]
MAPGFAIGQKFATGEVFAGLQNGIIARFDAGGHLLQTLHATIGSTNLETGMCFDLAGNLYATNWNAYTMTKFDNMGNMPVYLWAGMRTFDRPENCLIDCDGNILVGDNFGPLRQFDPNGNLLNTYNLPPACTAWASYTHNGIDWMDLAADQHTLYYTGEDNVIMTFDLLSSACSIFYAFPAGTQAYALRIIPSTREVLVATNNGVYRLNAAGTQQQQYPIAGPGGFFALNLDPDKRTFWTGSIGTGEILRIDITSGILITVFNAYSNANLPTPPAGTSLLGGLAIFGERTAANCGGPCDSWTALYSNAHVFNDMGFKIPTVAGKMTRNLAVAANGDVYVTGYSSGSRTGFDYVTIRYNKAGAMMPGWPQRYNGPVNGNDKAYSLAIDNSGNVYVTGESNQGALNGGVDIVTIGYDPGGNLIPWWPVIYTPPFSGAHRDAGYAIAVDGAGAYVYVTGESFSGTGIDYITICYNAATGVPEWARTYNGTANKTDKAYAIAVDPVTGDVAVTGESGGIGTLQDIATVRYTPGPVGSGGGVLVYSDRYDADTKNDYGFGITFNNSGDLFVVGASNMGALKRWDYTTIGYPAGGGRWVQHYDFISRNDYGYDLATDAAGNVYVTGASERLIGATTNLDYATIKYDPSGVPMWVHRYDSGINGADIARAIAVCDVKKEVLVTGSSYQGPSLTGLNYATLRLDQATGNQVPGSYPEIYDFSPKDIPYDIVVRPLPDTCCCVAVTGTFISGLKTKTQFATVQFNGCQRGIRINTPSGYDGEEELELPGTLTVYNNYPNPFNPTTTIEYSLPEEAYVTLKVYNVLGQEVASLLDHELLDQGTQEAEFDASNLPSGVYFYHIVAEGVGDQEEGTPGQTYVSVKKMLLMK